MGCDCFAYIAISCTRIDHYSARFTITVNYGARFTITDHFSALQCLVHTWGQLCPDMLLVDDYKALRNFKKTSPGDKISSTTAFSERILYREGWQEHSSGNLCANVPFI